ncbi:MAG: Endocytosis and vacuole integrity protein [Ramalina farinacea]|uniref:Endocytosis and vacuole integrity protein n=1 Tax=Ramalina farinacea TaxID=258253 RepID=A0AA43QRE0_9LECA|nr:Endocytosis and vacuole integrity protein [Ramalina farinacea]
MTAQLLTSELTTLLQDSKKKNPELRAATEKSLSDLNALPRTSEAQIVADLKSRPLFVKPFLLACSTRNPKFSGSAVACLQRLIVANALPTDTLSDVLNALRDSSSLGLDIQLKVLQALPSLLQNYSTSLTGQLLTAAFQVCFLLYGSQTAVVTNLAAAALQQLINTTYEKVTTDQGAYPQDAPASEVSLGDSTLLIQGSRLDAYKVLDDVCLLTEGHKPKYIQGATLAQNFGLELIESILASHAASLVERPEQLHTLQIRLMPFLTRLLSEKSSFSTTVHSIRVVKLVLVNFLGELDSQCETLLSLLNHLLDQDSAPLWKRVLCLELYKSFHADTALVTRMYARFDETDEGRNIIRDHLGSLARLASEKPAIIGLGSQSSTPNVPIDDSGEQAALQAGGLVGSIGAAVASIDLNTPGISTHWSQTKTPLMEQLDKQEPSPIPATYIYSLTLACLTAFEEGLARFLMPFTVPSEKKVKRKSTKSQTVPQDAGSQDETVPRAVSATKSTQRKTPVNPLSLTSHPLYHDIEIASHMIDQCWPALLAGSSTFLNASLDNENFHALIRSFQKFTQIAGLLGFSTPRDAFLTTLGKHALPSSRVTKTAPTPRLNDHEEKLPDDDSSRDTSPAPSISSVRKPESSGDSSTPIIGTRHLLCLRALLNLGIALGPVLHTSWSIIFETLQQADLLASVQGLAQKSKSSRSRSNSAAREEIGRANSDYLRAEITAVDTASSRLFESTADLDDVAFLDLLEGLCALLPQADLIDTHATANVTLSPHPPRKHQKLRSISGTAVEGMTSRHEGVFALDKVKDIIRCNIERFILVDDSNSGWSLLLTKLMAILSSDTDDSKLRIEAARALNDLLVLTGVNDTLSSQEVGQSSRARSLSALLAEVQALRQKSSHATRFSEQCGIDIHRSALDGLRAILEHCGDSLSLGWSDVLAIVSSVFEAGSRDRQTQPRSPILVRSSFGSLELICTDFLSSVPQSSLLQLLDTLYHFSEQNLDLNISLTTATFFRLLSDHLLRDESELSLENVDVNDIPLLGNTDSAARSKYYKVPVMWLSLLNRLVGITVDSRIEVRHSALHTIFRILDAQGDRMSNESFVKVHEATLRPLLQISLDQVSFKSDDGNDEMPPELFLDWSKTAVMIVESVSSLFSQWLDMYKHDDNLFNVLEQILGLFTSYLDQKINSVSRAVFGGLSRILSEIDASASDTFPLLGLAWSIWSSHHPVDHNSADGRAGDNNDALLAYLFCLGQLLRLTGQGLEGATAVTVVDKLRISTTDATASAYSTDMESMTPVQKAVIESLKMLPYIDSETDRLIVEIISEYINLPYQPTIDEGPPHHSFVALSKASMTVLEDFVGDRGKRNLTTAESGTPSIALSALHRSIYLKYRWKRVGREPLTWKKATMTAIAVLQLHVPLFKRPSPALQKYWEEVVNITNVIISADCKACQNKASIPLDEEFDIQAFSQIKNLLIPTLGSSDLTDDLRTKFGIYIFQTSLIHEPNPDDLAWPGEGLLDGLKRDHFGRVKALPPSPRSKMSYLLLDELFDLVADHGPSNERTDTHNAANPRRLARAAAPYLVLRLGLTLKMYIHDQPMRGRMPQPWSQKKEMLFILRKMVELKMEPSAFAGGEGMSPDLMRRKHLLRLYPLLLKALEAARMDEEMVRAIREALGAVEDFSQM